MFFYLYLIPLIMLRSLFGFIMSVFSLILFFGVALVSCSKESGSETILEFMESNYFETETKLNGEVYSYNLIQFDFSQPCVIRLRSQYAKDFSCSWDGLDDCQSLLFISDITYSDSTIAFRAKLEETESEEYPYEGSFILNKEFNDIELWINGAPLGGYKMVSKEGWDEKYGQTSFED